MATAAAVAAAALVPPSCEVAAQWLLSWTSSKRLPCRWVGGVVVVVVVVVVVAVVGWVAHWVEEGCLADAAGGNCSKERRGSHLMLQSASLRDAEPRNHFTQTTHA